MAVELCKVSLWMEALEPGKPLSFLDHRIRVRQQPARGDAGADGGRDPGRGVRGARGRRQGRRADPEGEEQDGADGADRAAARRRAPANQFGNIADSWASVDEIADTSISDVRKKEAAYERVLESEDYLRERLAADAWCAAFVMPKVGKAEQVVTEDLFQRLRRRSSDVGQATREATAATAQEYQFLHWHLTFPDVFQFQRATATDRRTRRLVGAEGSTWC